MAELGGFISTMLISYIHTSLETCQSFLQEPDVLQQSTGAEHYITSSFTKFVFMTFSVSPARKKGGVQVCWYLQICTAPNKLPIVLIVEDSSPYFISSRISRTFTDIFFCFFPKTERQQWGRESNHICFLTSRAHEAIDCFTHLKVPISAHITVLFTCVVSFFFPVNYFDTFI